MFLRADTRDSAQGWVNAINKAHQTAKNSNFAATWTTETIQSFVAMASSCVVCVSRMNTLSGAMRL